MPRDSEQHVDANENSNHGEQDLGNLLERLLNASVINQPIQQPEDHAQNDQQNDVVQYIVCVHANSIPFS